VKNQAKVDDQSLSQGSSSQVTAAARHIDVAINLVQNPLAGADSRTQVIDFKAKPVEVSTGYRTTRVLDIDGQRGESDFDPHRVAGMAGELQAHRHHRVKGEGPQRAHQQQHGDEAELRRAGVRGLRLRA
jgi:hypothetical protein